MDYAEQKRIEGRLYDACLDSGCTCTRESLLGFVDGFDEMNDDEQRASFARAAARATGEYVANYWETSKDERHESNPQQYVEWLAEVIK